VLLSDYFTLKKVANRAFNDENPNIVISGKKNLLMPSNYFAFLKIKYCK